MKELIKDYTIRKYYILKLINDKQSSFLYKSGWINSFNKKVPIDLSGNPIPWLSLSCIYFLRNRLQDVKKSINVFEYGSGNSTYFWAQHFQKVISIESDKSWYEYIIHKTLELKNSKILFYSLDDDDKYEKAILNEDEKFEIILIDGRKRVNCLKNSINKLSSTGVLILDDSHRKKYYEAHSIMKELNFKELPFWGMGPGSISEKCTSIYYKPNNCLNI